MNIAEIRRFLQRKAIEPGSLIVSRIAIWLYRVVSDYTNIQAWGLWVAAFVTGLIAVAYAALFRIAEFRFDQVFDGAPEVFFLLTPLAFLGAWYLVFRFAPAAGGSGIPQVMAAVEIGSSAKGIFQIERLLSARVAVVKALSSLLCLAGGGAIGREGPTLQISAAVFHFFGKQVRRFYPKADEQTWVIAGSAAGLASAFNTPLGGIVYAIEELGSVHFHRVKTALLSSVIISGLVAQTILGSYLYLGFPRLMPISLSAWPLVILTGFVCGISGAFFGRILAWLVSLKGFITHPAKLAAIAVFCGVIAAALNYWEHRSSGPGTTIISQILFESETASFGLIGGRMLATGVAYLSGAAGGIFSPSLAIGACIGSKVAYLFGSPNVNLLAMLGMIGFLTGLSHTPFTAFILVVEMSDRHSAVFPMMIAALVAHGAAKSVQSHSFYELIKKRFLPGE